MTDSAPDAVLGRVPSGIFILTIAAHGQATGMLASWVMQAGFAPLMLSVAIKRGRYVEDWLTEGHPFAINLVGESGGGLIKHFGKGFEPDDPATFAGLEITRSARGIPILGSALGHVECEPKQHVDSEDHRIFLARVLQGQLATDELPMVHIRKSGAHY